MPAIIIMPILNQRQVVSIDKTTCNQKYNTKSDNKASLPDKLMINVENNDNEDIEVFRKPAVKRDVETIQDFQKDEDNKKENSTNNSTVVDESSTDTIATVKEDINKTETIKMHTTTTTTTDIITTTSTTTKSNGPYSYPQYNNEFINTIIITTEVPKLPAVNDTRWQNFSTNNNTKSIDISVKTNYYTATDIKHNSNYITNDLPPIDDDRWNRFSNSDAITHSNEFIPLAGLYYDGFLHKPLKKYNFFPHHSEKNEKATGYNKVPDIRRRKI
ncbi:unnamed protein product [Diatraea saccharalis]|uniref:Uncharacterized protein n=1 Tax=Diatraea saccharalis TaxID=40085 RepID=A0A9N9QZD5_9NEOP|nr:unnamed protein product [Diatraea saccharalis]